MVQRIFGGFQPLHHDTVFRGSHPFSGSNQIYSEENRLGSEHQRSALLVGPSWIYSNNGVYSILHKVEWRIIGHTDLNPNGKYLLISNHVSSADILAVFVLAKNRLPFPSFFKTATALCAGFRAGPVELRDAGDEALQSRIPEP